MKIDIKCRDLAHQCRYLGLQIGDTIEGREVLYDDSWNDARLTLLWIGDEVAVFRVQYRKSTDQKWCEPYESASWDLRYRNWEMVTNGEG